MKLSPEEQDVFTKHHAYGGVTKGDDVSSQMLMSFKST